MPGDRPLLRDGWTSTKFEAQSRELSIAVLGGNATSSCEGIFLRPRMHLFGHREFYWPMSKADMWEF